jgi:hypothetical protein
MQALFQACFGGTGETGYLFIHGKTKGKIQYNRNANNIFCKINF